MKLPGELLYAITHSKFVGWRDPRVVAEFVRHAHAFEYDGIYLLDDHPGPGSVASAFSQECATAGLDFIIGYRDVPKTFDLERYYRLRSLTRRFGWGSCITAEWGGTADEAESYLRLAEDLDAEWVCPVIHYTMLQDINEGMPRRAALGDTLCVCMGGDELLGKLYHDEVLINTGGTSSIAGLDLWPEFEVDVERLRGYVEPMNVLCGAGFAKGLRAGSRSYAREAGFKGMIVGTKKFTEEQHAWHQLDLSGTLDKDAIISGEKGT